MAASALPTTLKSVTATKIGELKKQRQVYEEAKSSIGESVKRRKTGLEKTQALLDGTRDLKGVRLELNYPISSNSSELRNSHRLLQLASKDPAFPSSTVEKIFHDVSSDLNLRSVQHQHALFFSELVTEWISNPEEDAAANKPEDSIFETVGRKEMHEQRVEWESIVFDKVENNTSSLKAYLEKLFVDNTHKPVAKAFEDLKRSVSAYCHSLKASENFNVATVKTSLEGLIASDLLSEDKKAILKTFSSNKEILKEVADVLNMRFKSLESWDWTTTNEAINLEQRRQLNGKYRVFMDEDVLDALLVHTIGMLWAVQLRSVFTTFFNSRAWQRSLSNIPYTDRERREWFIGTESKFSNVQTLRRQQYARDYFMTQLPQDIEEGHRVYGDDSGSDDSVKKPRKNPLETKHGLLHLLIAETVLARHLNPQRPHTVIRSDFKWFGPSLSHDTIFTILEFFGVDSFWLTFFKKFLATPLRFVQDGQNGEIKVRTRGVPMSHALSDLLSESVLFVMDFSVNNSTKTNLYRLHDDFWFWGPTEVCKRAWHEMSVFCQVTGIEFNQEKTGSVTFQPQVHESDTDTNLTDVESGLPVGDIRWGFLRLNADTVRFEIDQSMVDDHIKELKYQLDGCTSLFSYVQAYNSYLARFFSNNFGKPSMGFGSQHIDMMISTLTRVQNALFPNGRVSDYLSTHAIKRFNLEDGSLPEGFWYFPVAMGGMELRNPLIPLFGMQASIIQSPEGIMEKALDREEVAYLAAKDRYDSGTGLEGKTRPKDLSPAEAEQFMSREEYMKFREERSPALARAYKTLLSIPGERPLETTAGIETLLGTLPPRASLAKGIGAISKNFGSMDPYWQLIVAIHGAEIVKKYGGLQMVDEEQVPLGVVSVMKAGKIRWRG